MLVKCLLLRLHIIPADELPARCGRRPAWRNRIQSRDVDDGLNKLIGGATSDHGKYPWTVNIYWRNVTDGVVTSGQVCGGAIISEYWVLTAASCLFYVNASSHFIVVGDFDRQMQEEGEQRFMVDEFIPHEQFTVSMNGDYNIALIKVANTSDGRGIRFNNYVQPICLPDYGQTCPDNESVVVTGWGSHLPMYLHSYGVLKEIRLQCRNNSDCRTRIYPGVEISDRMFCAGKLNGDRNVCEGDFGGPAALKIGSVFILVGIVSHGTVCELPFDPVIFSRVSEYLYWIRTTIINNSDLHERTIPGRT
ncbi:hypothetical protein BsWGS_27318 [Bradybaena similaris]